jgi:hypothetical protein
MYVTTNLLEAMSYAPLQLLGYAFDVAKKTHRGGMQCGRFAIFHRLLSLLFHLYFTFLLVNFMRPRHSHPPLPFVSFFLFSHLFRSLHNSDVCVCVLWYSLRLLLGMRRQGSPHLHHHIANRHQIKKKNTPEPNVWPR